MPQDHSHHAPYVNVNAVLAALTVLTDSATEGSVPSDRPFEPALHPSRFALLRAATAEQTELSLSIDTTDPIILDLSRKVGEFLRRIPEEERVDEVIVEIDARIHDCVDLLNGRRPALQAIADRLRTEGKISLPEVAAILRS